MRNGRLSLSTFPSFYLLSLLLLVARAKAAPQPLDGSDGGEISTPSCDCQWQYLKHYEAKGCSPVLGPAPCHCPTRFDCPKNFQNSTDDTKCLVEGRLYSVGDAVNTSNNCEICHCRIDHLTNRAAVSCVLIECPEFFRPRLPDGCYLTYKEGTCCPTGSKCSNESEASEPVCRYGGKDYRLGQKIYPEEDPCMICLCSREWSGLGGASCRRHECQIRRELDKLRAGCVPIYHEKTCCPIEYHCASDERPGPTSNSTDLYYDAGQSPERCRHPAAFGTCQEAFPRFHFNVRRRRCEEFLYSGCGGNDNRFPTLAECENVCGNGRNSLEERRREPTADQCLFAQRYYAVGELLDINHPTHCVTCTCSVPPDFTCIHRSCPSPPGDDYEHCTAEYKPGACCAQYTCQNTTDESGQDEQEDPQRSTCGSINCDPGCKMDDHVPAGTCPGCLCNHTGQEGQSDGRSVRETRTCSRVDPKCLERPGCRAVVSSEGCPQCQCDSLSPCLPPTCLCPTDAKCPEHGCRLHTNNSAPGQCSVCMCSTGRSLGPTTVERVQCPSASKCPDGCQLTSAGSDGCPACKCESDEAHPCLPPLCLCSPPHCEPACRVDRRVPLGRCPGCVCDLTKLDGPRNSDSSSQFNRGTVQDTRPNKRHDGSRPVCKPLSCEPPCKPESRPQDGQCPSCICRFEEQTGGNYPTHPGRKGGEPLERRYNGREDTPKAGECPVPPSCSGSTCKLVSVNGKCPECICTQESRTKSSPLPGPSVNGCPPADCKGEGCRAVTGPDGCPRCECSRQTCPESKQEEEDCHEPCEWQAKPKRGGCPRCLCPKEGVSGQSSMPRKCLSMAISSCDGVNCRLVPGPDGCHTCHCQEPDCGPRTPCRSPCALENQPNGRCPICVCPAHYEG